MNAELPFFPFYPTDFLSDSKVQVMSALEVGAYIRPLCVAWNETPGGSLPNNDRLLARWATLTNKDWAKHKEFVLAAFELRDDGRWHQKRMEREATQAQEKYRLLSESGKKGMEKRWGRNKEVITSLLPPYTEVNNNQNHNQNKRDPLNPPKGGSGADAHSPSSKGNKPKPKRKKRPGLEIPLSLQTPEFLEWWQQWRAHRKEKGCSLTPRAEKIALSNCEEWGAGRAVAAIKHSIACGYQGLFGPNGSAQARHNNSNNFCD